MTHTRALKEATIILGVTIIAIIIAAGVANAEYVKKPITAQQRIEAKCNMVALNAMNGFDIEHLALIETYLHSLGNFSDTPLGDFAMSSDGKV